MQFVFFYYLVKRMFRAAKVFVLLLRRRDLVKQLPGGYLRDLATSNRWVQVQLLGVLCLFIYPFTILIDTELMGTVRLVLVLIGFVALAMNITRLLTIRR